MSYMDMHRKEFEARQGLEDIEARELVQTISSRLWSFSSGTIMDGTIQGILDYLIDIYFIPMS